MSHGSGTVGNEPHGRGGGCEQYKLVRDFHALIVLVRAVKRSQEKKRIQRAKEKRDEERGRE